MDWTAVQDTGTYEIRVYDDGNERYMHIDNRWTISAAWLGKVKLLNTDGTTELPSMSQWKIRALRVDEVCNPQSDSPL
jgi:hypothetical protein